METVKHLVHKQISDVPEAGAEEASDRVDVFVKEWAENIDLLVGPHGLKMAL